MRRSFSWSYSIVPWITGILLLTFLVYAACLNNGFVVFDDNLLIYQNPFVEHFSFGSLFHIFTSYDPELYIPLTLLVYQMIHLVAGFNPGAYHAMSLLLHLCNTGLVAWIILQLSGKRSVAVLTAFLFALHPLQSESVLWAAALKDVLSGALGLLSVGLYLRYRSTAEKNMFIACIVCFFLGLLAKVSIAPLPILFLLIDWMQKRPLSKHALLEKWPFFGLSALFIVIALYGKTAMLQSAGVQTVLLLSLKAAIFYLWTLLWPVHLSVVYPQVHIPSLFQADIFVPAILVLTLCIGAYCARNRLRVVSFGLLWYILFLAPTFSNFYKNEYLYYASDRYAYLPSIGIFFVVAIAMTTVWERIRWSRIPLGIMLGISTLTAVVLVHARVVVWKDSHSLFANAIAMQPQSVVAHNNYGITITDSPEAITSFQKAIALDSHYILAYKNLASYYFHQEDFEKMKQAYIDGIAALDTKAHPLHDDLSLLFEYAEYVDGQDDRAQTISLLQKAIAFDPNYGESHYNLGIKYEKYGNLQDARPELKRAVELDGDSPDFLYHLAAVDAETGELQEAAHLLEHLLSINPQYAKAQSHLENIKKLLGE